MTSKDTRYESLQNNAPIRTHSGEAVLDLVFLIPQFLVDSIHKRFIFPHPPQIIPQDLQGPLVVLFRIPTTVRSNGDILRPPQRMIQRQRFRVRDIHRSASDLAILQRPNQILRYDNGAPSSVADVRLSLAHEPKLFGPDHAPRGGSEWKCHHEQIQIRCEERAQLIGAMEPSRRVDALRITEARFVVRFVVAAIGGRLALVQRIGVNFHSEGSSDSGCLSADAPVAENASGVFGVSR